MNNSEHSHFQRYQNPHARSSRDTGSVLESLGRPLSEEAHGSMRPLADFIRDMMEVNANEQ